MDKKTAVNIYAAIYPKIPMKQLPIRKCIVLFISRKTYTNYLNTITFLTSYQNI